MMMAGSIIQPYEHHTENAFVWTDRRKARLYQTTWWEVYQPTKPIILVQYELLSVIMILIERMPLSAVHAVWMRKQRSVLRDNRNGIPVVGKILGFFNASIRSPNTLRLEIIKHFFFAHRNHQQVEVLSNRTSNINKTLYRITINLILGNLFFLEIINLSIDWYYCCRTKKKLLTSFRLKIIFLTPRVTCVFFSPLAIVPNHQVNLGHLIEVKNSKKTLHSQITIKHYSLTQHTMRAASAESLINWVLHSPKRRVVLLFFKDVANIYVYI